MSEFDDLKASIRSWIGLQSVPDNIISSFIIMLETRINREMRVREMIQRSTAELSDSRITLPTDWIETVFLRYVSSGSNNPDVMYGKPLLQKTMEQFAVSSNDPSDPDNLKSFYAIVGSSVYINPAINVADGVSVEMGYYAKLPSLDNGPNWLFTSYYDIYLYGSLAHAGAYLVEDERVPLWEARVTKSINDSNDAWQRAKVSGGSLQPRFRSFG